METHDRTNAGDKDFGWLVWAVPLIVILHNTEEAFTMPKWLVFGFVSAIHQFGFSLTHIPTPQEVEYGLFFGAVVPLLIAAVAFFSGPRSFGLHLLAGIQSIMLTNALFPHLIATIVLREYTPGAITAILVVIPFSIFWFRRMLQRRFIAPRPLVASIIGGAIAYPTIMLLGLAMVGSLQ